MAIDYKQAGVDVDAADSLVDWIKSNQPSSYPHQEKIVSGIGGFSALFKADFQNYKNPCLVSSTDGVGTKLLLAQEYGGHKGIAQDLVAMCVNDLLCCGADPLFFLDYYATGSLSLEVAKEFIGGLQEACSKAGCALIGGETAEMPGVYHGHNYDCAGFSVGVVDKDQALGAHRVEIGDSVVAVESSGFHSNGYSLLRKVFAEDMEQWKDILLKPTHLYTELVSCLKGSLKLRAIANVTGGGMDNLLRVLPEERAVALKSWDIPEEFLEVKKELI